MSTPLRVLFLCSRNRLRSPTAEQVFRDWPGVEVDSAGLAPDADTPLSAEHLDWAGLIVVMENAHRRQLQSRHARQLKDKRVGGARHSRRLRLHAARTGRAAAAQGRPAIEVGWGERKRTPTGICMGLDVGVCLRLTPTYSRYCAGTAEEDVACD